MDPEIAELMAMQAAYAKPPPPIDDEIAELMAMQKAYADPQPPAEDPHLAARAAKRKELDKWYLSEGLVNKQVDEAVGPTTSREQELAELKASGMGNRGGRAMLSQMGRSAVNVANKVDNFVSDRFGDDVKGGGIIDDEKFAAQDARHEETMNNTGIAGQVGSVVGDTLLTAPVDMLGGRVLRPLAGAIQRSGKVKKWVKAAEEVTTRVKDAVDATKAGQAVAKARPALVKSLQEKTSALKKLQRDPADKEDYKALKAAWQGPDNMWNERKKVEHFLKEEGLDWDSYLAGGANADKAHLRHMTKPSTDAKDTFFAAKKVRDDRAADIKKLVADRKALGPTDKVMSGKKLKKYEALMEKQRAEAIGTKPRPGKLNRALGKPIRSNTAEAAVGSAATSAVLADEGQSLEAAGYGALTGAVAGGALDAARTITPQLTPVPRLIGRGAARKYSGAEGDLGWLASAQLGAEKFNKPARLMGQQFSNKDPSVLNRAIRQMRNVGLANGANNLAEE